MNYITIPLTKGQETIVDEVDRDLADLKWCVTHSKKSNRYYADRNNCKGKMLHICVLERKLGRELIKGELCDHINRNSLDNRRNNLRVANSTQNQANKDVQKNNTSGYKGVNYHKQQKRWRAYIYINKKQISLGYFNYAIDAALAYDKAALALHGEYAKLNL